MRAPLIAIALAGCAAPLPSPDFPAPDAWSRRGPGAPRVAFEPDALLAPCAWLSGDERDHDHHNLSVVWDGWLVHPWAPESGGGGITLYDMSDPCAPRKVGEGYSPWMRESHTLAFGRVGDRDLLAVDYHRDFDEQTQEGGIGLWDVTDPTEPFWAGQLAVPGYHYPDAYLRVTLHMSWQGSVLYVAGAFGGLFLVDVSDPEAPALLAQHHFEPNMLVGAFHVIGDRGMASFAGGSRTVLVDLSDPLTPADLPGGDFEVTDAEGTPTAYYFSNLSGRYGLFARKSNGGGPIVYDLAADGGPAWVSQALSPDGDGGYVFGHGDRLFQGESNFGAIYDFTDPTAPFELARVDIPGDLDTVTPIGHVMIVSVDDDAVPRQASAVMPWATSPDADPPRLGWHRPADGDTWIATTASVGLSFDELIEARSVHAGSLRVWSERGEAVPGRFGAQENIAWFTPDAPLDADTTYTVEVPAGGVADASGNPVASTTRFRFATGGALAP